MDYFQYVVRITNEAEIIRSDNDWGALIPPTIDYAEQRIYRELDLLYTRAVSTQGVLASSVRTLTLPTDVGTFIVVEQINAVSTGGTRYQMQPVTKEFIDAVYPNASTAVNSVPQYFAPISNSLYLVGPAPNASYAAEVIGTIRPNPLSSANSSTILTQYVPDLFMAASLIYLSETSEGKAAWEAEYQKRLPGAQMEQLRARFEGAAWTPMTPAPVDPPRV